MSDMAVLLVGEAQRVVDVPRVLLPPDSQEGESLRVQLDGNHLIQVTLDADATEATRQRIQEKLARLRRGDHLH